MKERKGKASCAVQGGAPNHDSRNTVGYYPIAFGFLFTMDRDWKRSGQAACYLGLHFGQTDARLTLTHFNAVDDLMIRATTHHTRSLWGWSHFFAYPQASLPFSFFYLLSKRYPIRFYDVVCFCFFNATKSYSYIHIWDLQLQPTLLVYSFLTYLLVGRVIHTYTPSASLVSPHRISQCCKLAGFTRTHVYHSHTYTHHVLHTESQVMSR